MIINGNIKPLQDYIIEGVSKKDIDLFEHATEAAIKSLSKMNPKTIDLDKAVDTVICNHKNILHYSKNKIAIADIYRKIITTALEEKPEKLSQ